MSYEFCSNINYPTNLYMSITLLQSLLIIDGIAFAIMRRPPLGIKRSKIRISKSYACTINELICQIIKQKVTTVWCLVISLCFTMPSQSDSLASCVCGTQNYPQVGSHKT